MVMMPQVFHVHYDSLLCIGLAGLIRVSYYYPGNKTHSLIDKPMEGCHTVRRQYLLANCIFLALLVGSMVLDPLLEHSALLCHGRSCGRLRLAAT